MFVNLPKSWIENMGLNKGDSVEVHLLADGSLMIQPLTKKESDISGVKDTMAIKDYIYCESCETFVDFWKYNHNIEDAGHEHCNWRYVTEEELKECINDCTENGCFEEEML